MSPRDRPQISFRLEVSDLKAIERRAKAAEMTVREYLIALGTGELQGVKGHLDARLDELDARLAAIEQQLSRRRS